MRTRHLLSTAVLALLPALGMSAQHGTRLAPAPVPGAGTKRMCTLDEWKRTARTVQLPAYRLPAGVPRLQFGTPGQLAVQEKAPHRAPATKKQNVLVSSTTTSTTDGGTPTETATAYTYDQFGNYKRIDYGNGISEMRDYVYADATSGKWTERTISRVNSATDDCYVVSREVRVLGSDGQVKHSEGYSFHTLYDDQHKVTGHELKKVSEKDFETSHSDPSASVLTSQTIYNTDTIMSTYCCVWSDYLQQYVYQTNTGNAEMEMEAEGNTIVLEISRPDSNGEMQFSVSYTYYFYPDGTVCGLLTETADGTLTGWKGVLEQDVPEKGFNTYTSYQMGSGLYGEWTAQQKIECNYDLQNSGKRVPYSQNYYYRVYDMGSDGQWKLARTVTSEWKEHNILLEQDRYPNGTGSDNDTAVQYTDDGKPWTTAWLMDNGAYILLGEEDGHTTYTYYGQDGTLLRKLRLTPYGTNTYAYQEWADGQWQTATGWQLGSGNNRNLLTFDGQGRLSSEEQYRDYGMYPYLKYLYTYTDNGYTQDLYLPDGTDDLYRYASQTVSTDAEGTVTTDQYWYATDGKTVRSGERVMTWANGKNEWYRWKDAQTQFVFYNARVDDLTVEDEADGMARTTVIKRTLDADRNVVETEKSVEMASADGLHTVSEAYTKKHGQWAGTTKTENILTVKPEFDYTTGNDYNRSDEYFTYKAYGLDGASASPYMQGYKRYDWDYTANAWKMYCSNLYDITLSADGNTLVTVRTYESANECLKNTDTYVRDDRHNLLQKEIDKTSFEPGKEDDPFFHYYYNHTYTYDEENRLTVYNWLNTRRTVGVSGNVTASTIATVTTYTYADIDVVDGITAPEAGGRAAFAVTGLSVKALGTEGGISLYSMDGQMAAQSATGTVTAPAPGLYMAVSGKARAKVVLK